MYCMYLSRFLKMLVFLCCRVSLKARAAWWFSKTALQGRGTHSKTMKDRRYITTVCCSCANQRSAAAVCACACLKCVCVVCVCTDAAMCTMCSACARVCVCVHMFVCCIHTYVHTYIHAGLCMCAVLLCHLRVIVQHG